jgi:sugar lactone lactonase YvrE
MKTPDDAALGETLTPDDPALAKTSAPAATGTTSRAALTREEPGRYDRKQELGRGGMGRVLVAVDRHLGREVALKELLAMAHGDGASSAGVARFVREARVTGQLEHPSIVPVHELGQRADGTIYYTMKRIRGRSLASVLDEARSIDERLRLVGAFRDVCQAMAYAHARGVVHRDLKPDNVMVGEFGETLVVDWGLAKVRGEDDPTASPSERRIDSIPDGAQTIDGAAIGTPSYMSPEQARGDVSAIDERSDVWGLGAMLFEILTGVPPFRGPSAMSVLSKVLTDEPPKVRELAPTAPPELAAIADRALRREPSERYATAKELSDEIGAFQDGRIVRAYEYSSWELVRRFVRRNRAATVAAAAIALATVVATGLVWQSYRAEQAERIEAQAQRLRAEDREIVAGINLAEATLERAERALVHGDTGAAAIYAAAMLYRDPVNPRNPHRPDRQFTGERAQRGAVRVARAYSTYVEADASRRWEYVRRFEAPPDSAVVGGDLVMPADGALVALTVETGARRRIDLAGATPESRVLSLGGGRVLVTVPGSAEPIVDLADGRVVAELPMAIDVASGGASLVTLGDGGALALRSLPDLAERALEPTSGADGLVVSPDGSRLAIRHPGWVEVRDLAGGRATRIEAGAAVRGMSFSHDGRWLGIARPLSSILLVSADGERREIPVDEAAGSVSWIDATTFAIGLNEAIELRSLDAASQPERVRASRASRHRVARVGSHLVDLPLPWANEPALATLYRPVVAARAEVLHEDGAIGAIAIDEVRDRIAVSMVGTVAIREISTGRALARFPVERYGSIDSLAIAADGSIAMWAEDGHVLSIAADLSGVATAMTPESTMTWFLGGLAVSPSGDEIFAATPGSGRIRRWSRTRGSSAPLDGHEGFVFGLAFSRDGSTLASASADGTVRLWDLASGEGRVLARADGTLVSDVAFSPDGARLATADGMGWIRIYEGDDEVESHRPHERWINRIAWWPDGRWIASASDDGTVRVTSVEDGAIDRIVRCGHDCLGLAPRASGDALFVPRDTDVVRVPLVPGAGTREPRELLWRAEDAAGLELRGLELTPAARLHSDQGQSPSVDGPRDRSARLAGPARSRHEGPR